MANKLRETKNLPFDYIKSEKDNAETTSMRGKTGSDEHVIPKSRFVVFAVALVLFASVILSMTASLQFSGAELRAVSETGILARSYTIPAPRGDIVDRNGVVLASTIEVNTLQLTNAMMKTEELNTMLLDLSYLLEEYHATPVAELSTYLSAQPHTFMKEMDTIVEWQVNKNLFQLTEPDPNMVVGFGDTYVKTDPEVFFLYLRKEKFEIDDTYTSDEAYRISVLRYQIMKDNWAFQSQGKPVQIATDVPQALIDLLLEQNYKYKGVISGKEYRRMYTPQAQDASHVVGYVGRITQNELANLQGLGYSAVDVVGKDGVEYQMERYLQGRSGEKPYNILTSAEDEDDWTFQPESMGIDPISGAKVTLTLDSTLQKVAGEALYEFIVEEKARSAAADQPKKGAYAGAVVVLNAKNGEILAMSSYPDYDPQDFILAMQGDASVQPKLNYYMSILTDEEIEARSKEKKPEDLKPMWNRAVMSHYAPGSTYKMVTAIAALESGIIAPGATSSMKFYCNYESPKDDLGRRSIKCHGYHENIDLTGALATSCNIYFAYLGEQTTINVIDMWAKKLGLGEYTGIDLRGEAKGIRANRENKKLLRAIREEQVWSIADTAQASFGQSDNSFSILQLARYIGGATTNRLVTPHVIKEVVAADGTILYEPDTTTVPAGLKDSTVELIKQGMLAVSEESRGTASRIMKDLPIRICSKTGTAETGNLDPLVNSDGLFVCAFPAENPEIIIASIVERGNWGAETANIAKKIIMSYLGILDTDKDFQESDALIGDLLVG